MTHIVGMKYFERRAIIKAYFQDCIHMMEKGTHGHMQAVEANIERIKELINEDKPNDVEKRTYKYKAGETEWKD